MKLSKKSVAIGVAAIVIIVGGAIGIKSHKAKAAKAVPAVDTNVVTQVQPTK